MKSLPTILVAFVVFLGAVNSDEAALISFDDMPVGSDYIVIQNGYGKIQWENFGACDGFMRPMTEGYRTGTISASNVAFNLGGEPGSIRSGAPFDLESAYLTAAFVNGLQLEVQAWTGTSLAYHNFYTLSPAGPTPVEFNYTGVDRVRFVATPSSQFVLDDLVVAFTERTAHSAPCTFALSPGSFLHGPGTETSAVSVTTQTGCPWAVRNTNTWVTIISSLNNSNSSSVIYRVAANPRALERHGTINIAGQAFAVSQSPGQPPPAHTPVDLGTVQVSTIGHSLKTPPPYAGPPSSGSVGEFLIDQDQSSGGDGVLPSVSVNWDTNVQLVLTISAPPGQRFLVQVPPGGSAQFAGFLWWESSRGGSSPVGPVAVSFLGLEGTPPDFAGSDAVLSDSQGFFGFSEITSSPFTGDLAFHSMTLTGTVEPQYAGYEMLNFIPHRESFLQIVGTPPAAGRLVSIVRERVLPRIQTTVKLSNVAGRLMMQGHPGRTNVVEASPDLIHWTPISTNVMPPIVCPSCPLVYVQDSADPTATSRFYRAFELR